MKKILIVLCAFFLSACNSQKIDSTPLLTAPSPSQTVSTPLRYYFTPTPKILPSITATFENRYLTAGLTDDQAKMFDSELLELKEAGKMGDKEFIADLIDYPIWLGTMDGNLWVDNRNDFLNYYDKYLIGHFEEVLANLEFTDDYIFASYHGLFIMHYDDFSGTTILFSNNPLGKIMRIDYGEFQKEIPVELIPTETPTFSITNTPYHGELTPTITFTPYWFASVPKDEKAIGTYLGTWMITRYEPYNFSYCNQDFNFASSQIGKKITLSADEVDMDDNFLFSGGNQDHIIYEWVDLDYFTYKDIGIPLPDNHPDRMSNPLFLDIEIDRMEVFFN